MARDKREKDPPFAIVPPLLPSFNSFSHPFTFATRLLPIILPHPMDGPADGSRPRRREAPPPPTPDRQAGRL